MTLLRTLFVAMVLAHLASAQGAVATAPNWTADVRPILAEHCFHCHGPDSATREAGLRLDTDEGLTQGALAPVVPGDPDASELLFRVAPESGFEHERMPPAGEPLSTREVQVLRDWIEGGAAWEPHWAYGRLIDAPPPGAAEDGRERTVIDRFVRAKLKQSGLDFARDADPVALVRRVHLDLTGLPPDPETVQRFVDDPSDLAYDAVVDELLASPAFAVHWARSWLDLARYADSHGFTIDGARSIWPWRDWVVDAVDRDMPFDQFTVEQLAGDLLPGATRAQRIATGFHRNTQVNQEGGAKDEENRVAAVLDRVATTGSVWLGSTVACAQCHTHKFDPLTHTEYYGLFAFFNSTADGGVSDAPRLLAPRTPEEETAVAAWERAEQTAEAAYLAAWDHASAGYTPWQPARATGSNGPELRPEHDGSYRVMGQNAVLSTYVLEGEAPLDRVRTLRIEVLPDGGPGRAPNRNFVLQEVRLSQRGPAGWQPIDLAASRADFSQDRSDEGGGRFPAASVVSGDGPGWAILPAAGRPHVLEVELGAEVEVEGRALRLELVQEYGGNHTIGRFRVLASAERPRGDRPLVPDSWARAWQAWADVRAQRPRVPSTLVLEDRPAPRVTHRFHRGSFLDPREAVEPHVPAALDAFRRGSADGVPEALTTRLDLARWLVDDRNALVQRVTVNRWWQALFGRGIVPTENDFGLRGARPSHPELLDWLAGELVRSGYSRKRVLRQIVRSTTYRQATRPSVPALELDPSNRLLARARVRPLSGEALRDCMLEVSGVLDDSLGGPPVQPPQPPGVFAFTQSAKGWTPSEGAARHRRSLYTRIWRTSPYPFYEAFGLPPAGVTCTRRTEETSPLQSLMLANDPMVLELCAEFGERLREGGGGPRDWVERAYRLGLSRPPRPDEAEGLASYARAVQERHGPERAARDVARVLFNLLEFTHRP